MTIQNECGCDENNWCEYHYYELCKKGMYCGIAIGIIVILVGYYLLTRL